MQIDMDSVPSSSYKHSNEPPPPLPPKSMDFENEPTSPAPLLLPQEPPRGPPPVPVPYDDTVVVPPRPPKRSVVYRLRSMRLL